MNIYIYICNIGCKSAKARTDHQPIEHKAAMLFVPLIHGTLGRQEVNHQSPHDPDKEDTPVVTASGVFGWKNPRIFVTLW